MKLDLRAAVAALVEGARPLLAGALARRFWLETALIGLLAVAAAVAVGRSAQERTASLRSETQRLATVRSRLEGWQRRAVPASRPESARWSASAAALDTLDEQSSQPLSVARVVASRAEEVGAEELAIRLAPPDSLMVHPPLSAGGWAVSAGQSGLIVEFSGGIGTVISFLGTLPPQVEVGTLDLARSEGRLRSRALLLLRDVQAPS